MFLLLTFLFTVVVSAPAPTPPFALSPRALLQTAFSHLTPVPADTVQTLHPNGTLFLSISLPLPSHVPIPVQASLSHPSNRLRLSVTPPNAPPLQRSIRLITPVDPANVGVMVTKSGVTLQMTTSNAVFRSIVEKCDGDLVCLNEQTESRCAGPTVCMERWCVEGRLRKCLGHMENATLVKALAELVLGAGCLAVAIVLGGGIILAIITLLIDLVRITWLACKSVTFTIGTAVQIV